MKNLFSHLPQKNNKGFTLVECCIAMVITLVCLLGGYGLIFSAVRNYSISKDLVIANSFAKAKVEELSGSQRIPGGNLNSNQTGYFDSPSGNYIRRWQIINDSMGTQTVRVRIVSKMPGLPLPEVNVATRMQ